VQALREAVAEVRTHGVARALGRPMPGVNAFSAPVFDHEGEAVLVITLLGHQDHLAADWGGPAAHAVQQAAARVSAHLGWRAPAALLRQAGGR
jgi:DNA-binding IclR family transcriptional regulator